MPIKKEQQRRRSLNDRLDAELAEADSIPVAGISTEGQQAPQQESASPEQTAESSTQPQGSTQPAAEFPTKKATTVMPKEVFQALQRFCIETDTPKHRVLYMFIIDGLHDRGVITDDDYQRFRGMASQLTTSYEKKK